MACRSAPAVTAERRYPGIPCCELAGQRGRGVDVTRRSWCPSRDWRAPDRITREPNQFYITQLRANCKELQIQSRHRQRDQPRCDHRWLSTTRATAPVSSWSSQPSQVRGCGRVNSSDTQPAGLRSLPVSTLTLHPHEHSFHATGGCACSRSANAAPPRRRRATALHTFALPPRP